MGASSALSSRARLPLSSSVHSLGPRLRSPWPSNMASKFADHTLYHLSPKGFWKKFRASCFGMLRAHWPDTLSVGDAVVINPEISSGLPIQGVHRYPPPASRPEKCSTPATKGVCLLLPAYSSGSCVRCNAASDPAQNPYWKRDVRRAYPQLSVVTQTELSTLLIEHHEAKQQAYVHASELSYLMCSH